MAAQSTGTADTRDGRTASPARAADSAGYTGRARGEPVPTVTPDAAVGGVIASAACGSVGTARPAGSRHTHCASNTCRSDSAADAARRPVRCIDCSWRPGTGVTTRAGRPTRPAISTTAVRAPVSGVSTDAATTTGTADATSAAIAAGRPGSSFTGVVARAADTSRATVARVATVTGGT
jgi:hypothetical protein